RPRLAFLNTLGQLGLMSACGYLLEHRYGMVGIAIAYAAAVILTNTVRAVQLRLLLDVSLPWDTITKYGLCWAAVAALALMASTKHSFDPFKQVVLAVVACVLCGVLMLWVSSREERHALAMLVRRRG